MDFPLFHLDWLGNRNLVGIIAVMHVLINHGLAVGMMPLLATMEWYGHKHNNPLWDKLAQRILFVCFIITTTLGAMSGVGIWLSVALVNPYGIASLIKVFFWGWFIEWIVFITEVCLILAYYLYWKKWQGREVEKVSKTALIIGGLLGVFAWFSTLLVIASGTYSAAKASPWLMPYADGIIAVVSVLATGGFYIAARIWTKPASPKVKHIRLGFALALFSWITMALIVAILGFMMTPGNWLSEHTLLNGLSNPLYLPQLAFRTPLSMTEAGIFAIFLTFLFLKKCDPFREKALRALAVWTGVFALLTLPAALWYRAGVPSALAENFNVSLVTLGYADWYNQFLNIILVTVLIVTVFVQAVMFRSRYLPRLAGLLPLLCIFWLTGHFERVREFIRKPYIIGQYMYANGLRVDDYPLLQRDGVLAHSVYSYPLSEAEKATAKGLSEKDNLTAEQFSALIDRMQQGKDVFMIACSRCHTTNASNAVTWHFTNLLGHEPWSVDALAGYMQNMHDARTFMPPFPGTPDELKALAQYLTLLQKHKQQVPGAQESGVVLNPHRRDPGNSVIEVKP